VQQETREARYAIDFGVSREDLRPEVQAEYDRLTASGVQASQIPYEPGETTARTPPEIRDRILAMFKQANSKYAKPFDNDPAGMGVDDGGKIPLLDTYRQLARRQQKKKDWPACKWWAERGLALYG
jgi:hypothetical protein